MAKIIRNSGEDRVATMPVSRFMADKGEYYEATDAIRDGNAPCRKFLFGQRLGNELLFFYCHGGLGWHAHVVYAQLGTEPIISSFATLVNDRMLGELEWGTSTSIKVDLRLPLVNVRDMKALNGYAYVEADLF